LLFRNFVILRVVYETLRFFASKSAIQQSCGIAFMRLGATSAMRPVISTLQRYCNIGHSALLQGRTSAAALPHLQHRASLLKQMQRR
jgi:hypothetical protein